MVTNIKRVRSVVALFQSDMAPVLISYDAKVLITGVNGTREMPVQDLYLNAGKKNIAADEILLGVKIPPRESNWHSAYIRKTVRGSFDFPLLSCAILIKEQDGKIIGAKVVMGAAGVKPQEVAEVADILTGKNCSDLENIAPQAVSAVKKIYCPIPGYQSKCLCA